MPTHPSACLTVLRGLLLALAFALALPASAQTPVETEDLDTAISAEVAEDADAAGEARLAAIYSQLSGLTDVTASLSEGVVTLEGEVLNEEQAERAVSIARRLDGVVAVQDSITRTLDVSDNVGVFSERLRGWSQDFLNALPLLLVGLGTWIAFILLGRFFGGRLGDREGWLARFTPNPFLAEVAGTLLKLLFVLVGLVVALNIVGASSAVATILGGAGVLGIAFGFAIRDTLENYIASILLSLRQPFRAGDHVVINDTHEGKVARLTSRATILVTLDGNHLRIPNSDVFKGTILNYTTNPKRRFKFELGVDSADDPVSAIETGLARIREFDFVLDDPPPNSDIIDVGDSSIVIQYRGWIDQTQSAFGKSRSLVIQGVKSVLEGNGFSLPEPIYRLKIDGLDTAALPRAGAGATTATVREVTPDVPDDADVTPDTSTEDALRAEAAKNNLLADSAASE